MSTSDSSSPTARDAAAAIVRCCRYLRQADLIAGFDGNVSVRLDSDRLLVTPAGAFKGELVPEDLVVVGMDARVRDGSRLPTSELDLHLRIYRKRPDCGAVVHAHPPTATAFAVVGRGLSADVLPELALGVGQVPLAPYALTGTPALGDSVEPFIGGHDAVLLANHGAVTWGPTLDLARARMEWVEHAAKILFAAEALGAPTTLTAEQQAALQRLRGNSSYVY